MSDDGPCPWSDCWCKLWPPVRRIFSTGQDYTVEEVEPGIFAYRYLPMPSEEP